MGRTKMKAFAISALFGLAAAAPSPAVSSHVISHGHGAVVSHGSHVPHHGFAHHGPIAHPVAHHAVHAPAYAPVVPHAPAYKPAPAPYKPAPAPYKPAPAYKAAPYVEPEGKDEPYSYQYGVADDYSKANF